LYHFGTDLDPVAFRSCEAKRPGQLTAGAKKAVPQDRPFCIKA